MIEIRQVALDHPDAQGLITALQAFYVTRYGGADETPVALFEDADAEVGGGIQRWQDEYPAHRGVSAWLAQQRAAQPVRLRLAPPHPLGPGRAADEEVAAEEDPPDLALGVHVDRGDRSGSGRRLRHRDAVPIYQFHVNEGRGLPGVKQGKGIVRESECRERVHGIGRSRASM